MFFDKKKSIVEPDSIMDEVLEQRVKSCDKKKDSNAPLLERYLQKNMTDYMRNIDDEALAKAIQTFLYEDKNRNKHMN